MDDQSRRLDRYTDLIFPARITGAEERAGGTRYSWVELQLHHDDTYRDVEGGRHGDATHNWAVEINGRAAAEGDTVWLRPRGAVDGHPVYEFSAGGDGGFWARLVSKTVTSQDRFVEYGWQRAFDSNLPDPITWAGSGSGAAPEPAYEVNDVDLPVVPLTGSGAGGPCCPDTELPDTLVASLTAVTGSCSCLPASLTLGQVGTESYAVAVEPGDSPCGSTPYALTFGCIGSSCAGFALSFAINGSTEGVAVTPLGCSCSPFEVAFRVEVDVPGFCVGAFTVTLTAGDDGKPSQVVWMRSGRGDYKLFEQTPRWEDVEVTDDEPLVIDGVSYYPANLIRYDQDGKSFCRRRPVLVRIATSLPAQNC